MEVLRALPVLRFVPANAGPCIPRALRPLALALSASARRFPLPEPRVPEAAPVARLGGPASVMFRAA